MAFRINYKNTVVASGLSAEGNFMEKKTKDCVFALGLIALGLYVIYESWNMIELASKPPFNIKQFRVSPGMLPMVLGWGLVVFSLVLLATSIRGGGMALLTSHVKTTVQRVVGALGEKDMQSMIVSTAIMFVYTFIILGLRIDNWQMPFWAGAMLFLILLIGYLRATKWWTILLCSGVSVALIVVLFQVVFKTSLP